MGAMTELMTEIPEAPHLLEGAIAALKNQIETERIIRTKILFNYEEAMKLGLKGDRREAVYAAIEEMDFEQLRGFHEQWVKGKDFNIMVLGDRNKVDFKVLEAYGPVTELSLEEVFGY